MTDNKKEEKTKANWQKLETKGRKLKEPHIYTPNPLTTTYQKQFESKSFRKPL